MGKIRKWILKLVLEEIRENGCEIGGYTVEVIDGTFTIKRKEQ
jgi:prophage antirepressor-like protein